VDEATLQAQGPQVNAGLVGVFPTVGQTIEDRHGKPIEVNSDINGKESARPFSGPLADLKNGLNEIIWSARRRQ
jgi:hypothetical protein